MYRYYVQIIHWFGKHDWVFDSVLLKYNIFPYAKYKCTYCDMVRVQGVGF